jgi:CRP/FNR family transcriptional regulator
MAGEILGMDGISTELHTCNAVALEDSEVCLIPFTELELLSSEIRSLQHHLHKVMSREIVRDHGVMMLLGTMRAEERLAAFLLNLSQRFTARGYSPAEFHLRMTREEIGSYLGLKLETVSRAFSRFQDDGLHLRAAKAHPHSRYSPAEGTADAPRRPHRLDRKHQESHRLAGEGHRKNPSEYRHSGKPAGDA